MAPAPSGCSLTYAVVRYHVFKGVDWSHFPLFIANKGCSLAAVFFIASSYLISKIVGVYGDESGKRLALIKFCGLLGFSLATIHTLMAVLLFSPDYCLKFFHDSGRMNLTGELSMLLGVLSLWCLSITAITSLPFMYNALGADRWHRGQRMGYFSLLLGSGHVLVLGISGWTTPTSWLEPSHRFRWLYSLLRSSRCSPSWWRR